MCVSQQQTVSQAKSSQSPFFLKKKDAHIWIRCKFLNATTPLLFYASNPKSNRSYSTFQKRSIVVIKVKNVVIKVKKEHSP